MIEGNIVWYSLGYTINLGNFENAKCEIGESRSVVDGEDPQEIYEELRKDVNNRLAKVIEKIKE